MGYSFEIVFFSLYDIGRAVDLKKAAGILHAEPGRGTELAKRRDTPASVLIPKPLVLMVASERKGDACAEGLRLPFESLSLQAKVYDDGAITMVVRVLSEFELSELHAVRMTRFEIGGEIHTVDSWADANFRKLYESIRSAVSSEHYVNGEFERESYAAFCLLDPVSDPKAFIDENGIFFASLLMGERPDLKLHESQVEITLKHPFSFLDSDIAVFDLDRCVIIDPSRDYEDLLLIAEHARYQLLELRTLDALLDRWLDEAEKDLGKVYSQGATGKIRPLRQKHAKLQALRFDALFILENLENSSKIIGDYYLGQIYAHLCEILNTQGWKANIERRLDTLQSIYEMAKSDVNERNLLILEALCVVFFAIQIIQMAIPLLP